jgi:hypothetical protein
VPRVIGSRIDAAGLAKIAAGKVRDEMKLAIITTMCCIIQSVSSGVQIHIDDRICETNRSRPRNSFMVNFSLKPPFLSG